MTTAQTPGARAPRRSPFEPGDEAAYGAWRERKLADFPASIGELRVPVADGLRLQPAETAAIGEALRRANLAVYRLADPSSGDKVLVRQLGRQFGLERLDDNLCADEDAITSLQVVGRRREGEYIPYTDRRLNWHTDGYYNSPDRQIRAIVMHCVRPAAEGGENALLDHEIAYILLRDEDPALVEALMQPDAMTIPPNVQDGRVLRPAQGGPVFSVDAHGHLHMRYSARARNIEWKDDARVRRAAERLLGLFEDASPYIFRHRLEAGEGIISNNVLHCRTAFSDDPAAGRGRLLYRARYFDRAQIPAR
ncbi:MAG TPA: taurine catabolism dioxygenase TauD [Gammaproteobacteria bacterium]|nr:taurine catabolism dioxygenase TauD [Gammaproteobacteria bacterium]